VISISLESLPFFGKIEEYIRYRPPRWITKGFFEKGLPLRVESAYIIF
jgi:hypothetical protein